MKIGKVILLNEFEIELANRICRIRQEVNFTNKVQDKKFLDDGFGITLIGFGAELAFCRLFNLYPDFTIYSRSSIKKTDSHDAILDGKTIDIKTTSHENGNLVSASWKKGNPPDFLALMISKFPKYKFCGFVSKEEMFSDERLVTLRKNSGPCYKFPRTELKEWSYYARL